MRLRATVRVRNEEMLEARARLGLGQRELADLAGVQVRLIGAFEALNFRGRESTLLRAAGRLALALGLPEEKVLPPALLGEAIQSTHAVVVDADEGALLRAAADVQRRLIAASPADTDEIAGVDGEALKRSFEAVFQTLTPGERRVLELRHGWDGKGERTLAEVARALGRSRERVRQVYLKAVSKCRAPSRTTMLLTGLPVGDQRALARYVGPGNQPASISPK